MWTPPSRNPHHAKFIVVLNILNSITRYANSFGCLILSHLPVIHQHVMKMVNVFLSGDSCPDFGPSLMLPLLLLNSVAHFGNIDRAGVWSLNIAITSVWMPLRAKPFICSYLITTMSNFVHFYFWSLLFTVKRQFTWKESLQLLRRVKTNAYKTSLLHCSFIVSLWTFQLTFVFRYGLKYNLITRKPKKEVGGRN